MTGRLHEGLVCGPVGAHDHGDSRHAFATDEADLKVPLASSVGDDGCKPVVDEIDRVDPAVGRFKRHEERQIDGLEVWFQQRGVSAQEPRQDAVSNRLRHCSSQ